MERMHLYSGNAWEDPLRAQNTEYAPSEHITKTASIHTAFKTCANAALGEPTTL